MSPWRRCPPATTATGTDSAVAIRAASPCAEARFGHGDAVPVPVAAGDAVLLDVALLHRSGPNASDVARIGLNARYLAPGAVRTRDGSAPILDPISGTAR